MVGRLLVGDQAHRHPAVDRDHGGVDVGDRVLDDVGEGALECSKLQDLHVVLDDLAAYLDVELHRDATGERGEGPPQLLGQRDAGPRPRRWRHP